MPEAKGYKASSFHEQKIKSPIDSVSMTSQISNTSAGAPPLPMDDSSLQTLSHSMSVMTIHEDQLKDLKEKLRLSYDELQKRARAVIQLVPRDNSCVLDPHKMTGELRSGLDGVAGVQAEVQKEFDKMRKLLQATGSQAGDIAVRCMNFKGLVDDKKQVLDTLHKQVEEIVNRYRVTPERKLALSIRWEHLLYSST